MASTSCNKNKKHQLIKAMEYKSNRHQTRKFKK